MKITSTQATLGLGLVALAGVYLVGRQALKASGSALAAAGQAINPASPENVVYKGASAVVNTLAADGRDAPLGARLWEWMNPGKVAAEAALTQPVQRKSIAEPGAWVAADTGGATGTWGDPTDHYDELGNFIGRW